MERVAVGGDEIDDHDNRYPGTQCNIMTDGSVDGVDDVAIQSLDVDNVWPHQARIGNHVLQLKGGADDTVT